VSIVGFVEDGARVGPSEVWRRVDSWEDVGVEGVIVLRFFFFFFSSVLLIVDCLLYLIRKLLIQELSFVR